MATNNLNFYSFALKITSPSSTISLPIKMSSVSRLRIKSLSYVTGSSGNIYMIIDLKGWDNNAVFYDGNNVIPYTKFLLMPPSINTPMMYDNPYNTSFDVIKQDTFSSITTFFLDISINNNTVTSNEISTSNPIYIEIYVEGNNIENKNIITD